MLRAKAACDGNVITIVSVAPVREQLDAKHRKLVVELGKRRTYVALPLMISLQLKTKASGGSMTKAFCSRPKGLLIMSLVTWVAASSQTISPASSIYDIIIRHGRVLDGAGNPWIAADVAISGGRFVKIGKVEGTGKREIDAKGLYVSPGWIDVMHQSASVLLKNGLADNKLREGVTTAIGGEGGTPVDAAHIGEYFDQLQKQVISLNFGCYYSEAQARVAVIGHVDRIPTPEEL